jgi:hypothetical protein
MLNKLSANSEMRPGSDLLPSMQWDLPLPVDPYIKIETFTPSVNALKYGGNYILRFSKAYTIVKYPSHS